MFAFMDRISGRTLIILACILTLPALVINLGMMPFIDDEGIRALVAMEMDWSGNYVVPTLNGAYYYNKPPLYNWILLGFFKLTGTVNEWTERLPTIFFLIAFCLVIYAALKKETGWKIAGLTAFLTLSCGRFLFWDSFRGLIDTLFSLVIFLMFMVIVKYARKEKWWKLFLLTYTLAGIGFLLKSFPAILFAGFSLLTILIYRNAWKRLFSIQHIAGVAVMCCILGSYYFAYHQHHDFFTLLPNLLGDSVDKTAVDSHWTDTVLHILSFPLEMTYHFLPWSLFIFLLLIPGTFKRIKSDYFLSSCMLLFLANVWVYWISPVVYPRYLLMFSPLLFAVLLSQFQVLRDENSIIARLYFWVFVLFMSVGCLAFLAVPFVPALSETPQIWLKSLVLFVMAVFFLMYTLRTRKHYLMAFVCMLLIARIGFNIFIMPSRSDNNSSQIRKLEAHRIGSAYVDKPLKVMAKTPIESATNFYMSRAYGNIIQRVPEPDHNAYFLMAPWYQAAFRKYMVDSMRYKYMDDWIYVLDVDDKPE